MRPQRKPGTGSSPSNPLRSRYLSVLPDRRSAHKLLRNLATSNCAGLPATSSSGRQWHRRHLRLGSGQGRCAIRTAVPTVAAGEALLSPTITKRVIQKFARMPRPAPPKELDDLSEREREVFRLIARGLSNGEIARELYISETTVKTHITHILQKLNLRDRVQAVVLAYQTGVFEADTRLASSRDKGRLAD